MTPPPEEQKDETSLVSTVKENMIGFTKRQIKDAKRAHELYRKGWLPDCRKSQESFEHEQYYELSRHRGRRQYC